MQINGTAYGVALNDAAERDALAGQLHAAPYGAPPLVPVVFIKPRNCILPGGGRVFLPGDCAGAVIGSSIAIHFSNAVSETGAAKALQRVCMSLAIDVSLPGADYYRPAIAEKCRDGFLPVGPAVAPIEDLPSLSIETLVDGERVHEWRLDRLHRSAGDLIAELSGFMTLEAGDLLLVGVAGDAPQAPKGSRVTVRAQGFPELAIELVGEGQ